ELLDARGEARRAAGTRSRGRRAGRRRRTTRGGDLRGRRSAARRRRCGLGRGRRRDGVGRFGERLAVRGRGEKRRDALLDVVVGGEVARLLELRARLRAIALRVVDDGEVEVRLEERRTLLDHLLVFRDRAIGLAALEVHRPHVGADLGVVGLLREVLLVELDRLRAILVVVRDVGEAADPLEVVGLDLEDVLERVLGLRRVARVEPRGAVVDAGERRPRADVLRLG